MTPDGATTDPFAPLTTQMLPVDGGHQIYVETTGRPDGIPVVYLHGGPGSGCQPGHRRLFDPNRFRAVLFDQRGAGRSLPARSRENNTTAHLVADMETIRETLGIERWMIVGGSWGATLALAYAERHPERVSGIVLRATFLGTRAELEWAFGGSLNHFHPGLHDDFLSMLPEAERSAPLDGYWRRILDPDPSIHGPFARAWYETERILSEATPAATRLDFAVIRSAMARMPTTPFMEAHYFAHDAFLVPDELMANAGRLAGIPGVIVQGQYDLLCPQSTAYRLAAAWGNAQIRIVPRAGHSLGDPGVTEAVMAAIASLASGD